MKKILVICLILSSLSACSKSSTTNNSISSSMSGSSPSFKNELSVETYDLTNTSYDMSEKISYTVSLDMETKDFTQSLENIEQNILNFKGFIEKSEIYGSFSQTANYTVRIPTSDYLSFIDNIKISGNIFSISTSTENLTSDFIDTNARLTSLEVEEKRLLELLEIASSIEDIITIEARLSQVRYDIERLETSLRSINLKVDYSTIYINVHEVIEYQENDNFFDDISKTISNSLNDLQNSFKGITLSIIYIFPFLLIWIVTIFIVYIIFKKPIKKIILKFTLKKEKLINEKNSK